MFEYYDWFRAVHIIAVIFWMAGLLYLPRLFVYHSQAELGGELDNTLKIQEKRLLRIIMNPSLIVATLMGLILLHLGAERFFAMGWIHVKLLLVFILLGYHGFLAVQRKKFEAGERPHSEKFFRIINEVPPILAIIIVILAVVEPF